MSVEYDFTHKSTPDMIKLAESNQMLYDAIQSATLSAEFIRIRLDIINHESIAYVEETMNSDAIDIRTAIAASGHKEPIYSNLKTCEVLISANENIFDKGKYYYEEERFSLKWDITNETKEVLGFVCYKAVSKSANTQKSSQVVAWFTPDIPFQFGPGGYINLPGLILELEEERSVFTAKNINFNPDFKKFNITPPSGNRLSKNEYQEKSKEIIETMKRNF